MPEAIKVAAEERRLLIFLGAGISCAAGLPSWDRLKETLVQKYKLRLGALEDERHKVSQMDFYECFGQIHRSDRDTYDSELKKALACNDPTKLTIFKKWIKQIKLLKPSAIITTNIDNLIPNCGVFMSEQLRFKGECCPQELRDNKVFCLHGNISDNVFNLFDIDTLYSLRDFQNFLHNVFGSYCVLFLGYSCREKRLLEFARINNRFMYKNSSFYCHYALLPNNNMINTLELEQYYGIKVLSYDNSKDNYENFIPTIESWATPSLKVKKARGKKDSKAQAPD